MERRFAVDRSTLDSSHRHGPVVYPSVVADASVVTGASVVIGAGVVAVAPVLAASARPRRTSGTGCQDGTRRTPRPEGSVTRCDDRSRHPPTVGVMTRVSFVMPVPSGRTVSSPSESRAGQHVAVR